MRRRDVEVVVWTVNSGTQQTYFRRHLDCSYMSDLAAIRPGEEERTFDDEFKVSAQLTDIKGPVGFELEGETGNYTPVVTGEANNATVNCEDNGLTIKSKLNSLPSKAQSSKASAKRKQSGVIYNGEHSNLAVKEESADLLPVKKEKIIVADKLEMNDSASKNSNENIIGEDNIDHIIEKNSHTSVIENSGRLATKEGADGLEDEHDIVHSTSNNEPNQHKTKTDSNAYVYVNSIGKDEPNVLSKRR